jgi:hypothetical protein
MAITTVQGQMLTAPLTLTGNLTFSDSSIQTAAASPYVLKNRIINGAMVIDQRNAGASVTPTADNTYTLDRWAARLSASSKFSVQQSTTAPAGFINSLKITSLSAYTLGAGDFFIIQQAIEGLNTSDLGWGTVNAQTVTLSFRVYSSLTGTFGGSVLNSSGNRSYPFTYSIPVANTWTTISVTIAGDTGGTWLTTNGTGVQIWFGLGVGTTYSGAAGSWSGSTYFGATGATSVVGTSGATFYITGVQLEQNTSATPFERRLYDKELISCQRYFEKSFEDGTAPSNGGASTFSTNNGLAQGVCMNGSFGGGWIPWKVTKRATPTVTTYGNSSGYWGYASNAGALTFSAFTFAGIPSQNGQTLSQQVVNNAFQLIVGHYTVSAEL